MAQKTVLITGATSGIGRAGAEALGRKGWRVLVHARSEERGLPILAELRALVPTGTFELVVGDLSSLKAVVHLAEQVAVKAPALDVLWNNAGGLQTRRQTSADGLEFQRAVNALAPFVLTEKLLPNLKAAPRGRVVSTASMAHAFAPKNPGSWLTDDPARYSAMGTYGLTKLANIVFTLELQKRLEGTTVTAHCFHPGWVNTGFGSSGVPQKPSFVGWLTGKLALPPEAGADTGVFLVDDATVDATPGQYWVKRQLKKPSAAATPEAGAAFWAEAQAVADRILKA